nr:ribonuclease H-like domain-containing protein [Tanacetum cinerariifolium]
SWLWHYRLSHLNFDYITSLAKHGLVRGFPKLKYQKDHLCSACALGKKRKTPTNLKLKTPFRINLSATMDLCGPMRIQSINGRKYILVIVDDYSQFTWVKFLQSKDEVPDHYSSTDVSTDTPSSTTIDQDAPSTCTSQRTLETLSPVIPLGVEEVDHAIEVEHVDNNPNVDFLILEPSSKESSTQVVIPNNVHTINQPPKHINKWTKDHLTDNVIGDPFRLVSLEINYKMKLYSIILMLSFLLLTPRVIEKH